MMTLTLNRPVGHEELKLIEHLVGQIEVDSEFR